MCLAILIDLFHKLFLIGFRCRGDRFFHSFMDVCVCFDMGPVHKYNFRGKITALLRLKKDPCKHLFYSVLVESVPEVITDGGKMRNRFIEQIAKKPPVCDIHADLFHGTPQGWDPIQVLDEHHLKQDHRINAGTPVIRTIKVFHKIINMSKIHCTVNFPKQMILRNKPFEADHFQCISFRLFFYQHVLTSDFIISKKASFC